MIEWTSLFAMIALGGACVGWVWSCAGHKWKSQPNYLFLIGSVMSALMILSWLYLDGMAVGLSTNTLPSQTPKPVFDLHVSIIRGVDLSKKVIELFFLPVLVGIFGMAFSYKVEASLVAHIADVSLAKNTYREARLALAQSSKEMYALLDLSPRAEGNLLKDSFDKHQATQRMLVKAIDRLDQLDALDQVRDEDATGG